MKIAEFFIGLGVKGDDKTNNAIGGIRSGIGEIRTTSLAAKAAIVGVVYGLERMMSHSAQQGANLVRFANLTGLSTKRLQQWQFAAKMASVSNEEVTGSFKSVQGAMANMLLGKGSPEGMHLMSAYTDFDVSKARDTFYVMEKISEFAKKAPKDVGNTLLQSFGIGEGMITAMRRNAFTAEKLMKAPIYTQKEIKKLEKVNAEWSKLGHLMKLSMGKITSKHGTSIMGDLNETTKELVTLIEALVTLSGKLEVFKVLNKAISGWGEIFKAGSDMVSFFTSEKTSTMDKQVAAGNFITDIGKHLVDRSGLKYSEVNKNMLDAGLKKPRRDVYEKSEMTINQIMNFKHDGKDSRKVGTAAKTGAKEAYRQMNQGQEN